MNTLKGWQRDTAFTLFYTTFTSRTMSLLLGWPGTGKSYLTREFVAECSRRKQLECNRRRMIDFERAVNEFCDSHLFKGQPTGQQIGWLQERFCGDTDRKVSRCELDHWLDSYRRKPGAAPEPLEEEQLEEDAPTTAPTPILVTPSATTSPSGLVRRVYSALGRPQKIAEHFTDSQLYWSLEELREKRNILLLIDECQRLEPKTLAVVREFHDDGEAPIVLIATPEIRATLAQPRMASLLSRIAFEEHIGPISEEQLTQVCPDLHAAVRQAMIRASSGNFRAVVNLLRAAEQVREAEGSRSLTIAHLREASEMVPGARWTMAPQRSAVMAGEPREEREGKHGTTAEAGGGAAALRRKAASSAG